MNECKIIVKTVGDEGTGSGWGGGISGGLDQNPHAGEAKRIGRKYFIYAQQRNFGTLISV
jgi:hypothetical protein